MKKICTVLLVFLILSTNLFSTEKSELEEFEKEVNKPVESSSNNNDDGYSSGSEYASNLNDDDEDEGVFSQIFGFLFVELFFGHKDQLSYYYFQEYPYANGQDGRYITMGKSFDFQIYSDYIYHSDKLAGHSIQGNLNVTPYLSLNGKYMEFREELEVEDYKLKFYDLYLDYFRFRGEYGSWCWGVGTKYMNGYENYWGFSTNSELEIFPIKPLSLKLSGNLSGLNKHLVTEWRSEAAIHLWKVRFNAGYHQIKTSDDRINGLVVGVGINF